MLGGEAGLGLIAAGLLFGPVSGYAYGDVMDHVSRRNAARRVDLSMAPLVSPSGGAGLVGRLRF
ncbi:MAG: hypothetical protein ACODAB_04915 [Gemmatimonadota bacterium]